MTANDILQDHQPYNSQILGHLQTNLGTFSYYFSKHTIIDRKDDKTILCIVFVQIIQYNAWGYRTYDILGAEKNDDFIIKFYLGNLLPNSPYVAVTTCYTWNRWAIFPHTLQERVGSR